MRYCSFYTCLQCEFSITTGNILVSDLTMYQWMLVANWWPKFAMPRKVSTTLTDRSQRNFAHNTTVTLLLCALNSVVISRVHFKPERWKCWSNFEFDRIIVSRMGVAVNCQHVGACVHLHVNKLPACIAASRTAAATMVTNPPSNPKSHDKMLWSKFKQRTPIIKCLWDNVLIFKQTLMSNFLSVGSLQPCYIRQ